MKILVKKIRDNTAIAEDRMVLIKKEDSLSFDEYGALKTLARTIKDTVLRYKTMMGYNIKRRDAGWDCHGQKHI